MSARRESTPIGALEPPETRPAAGGAYERLADGSLVRVGGGTATPDRIAPALGSAEAAPPPDLPAAASAPRATRSRRS